MSSFVLAGDRLYVPNQNADVFVLRASPTFECLATNSLAGEPMNASLAVADGSIFLRTHRQLWCVATGPSTPQLERTTAAGNSASPSAK